MGLKTIVMLLINDQTVHYLRDTNYGRNEPHNAANMWHKICDFIYISRSSDCNAKYVIKIYTDIYNLKIVFKELPDNGNIIIFIIIDMLCTVSILVVSICVHIYRLLDSSIDRLAHL